MKETESEKDDLLSGSAPTESAGSSSAAGAALPGREPAERVTREDVTQQADATRLQLQELQRRREELEREKNELEELRRKQDEYETGRKEMVERLSRGLVLLEHEQVETARKAENIANALASFKACKEQIESIREEQWNNANLKEELAKALAVVDTARNELNHYRARLDVLDEQRNPEAAPLKGALAEFEPGDGLLSKVKFPDLIKIGFALSLPVLVLGIILLIVLATKK
jgi:chromosome segregation ATPase